VIDEMLTLLLFGFAIGILLGVVEGLLGKYWIVVLVGGMVVSAVVIIRNIYMDPMAYNDVNLVDILLFVISLFIGSELSSKATKNAVKSWKGK